MGPDFTIFLKDKSVPGPPITLPSEDSGNSPNLSSPLQGEDHITRMDLDIEEYQEDGYQDLNPQATPPCGDSDNTPNVTSEFPDKKELKGRGKSVQEEKEDTSNSTLSRSTSNYEDILQENVDHSWKKTWWKPFTFSGDQSRKKPGWYPFKSSGDDSGQLLELVKKVPVFKMLEDHVLNAICEHLSFNVYTKSSKIFREKKPIEHMLFIVSGKLEYLRKDGTIGPLEDFCGEELLFWHGDMTSVNTSKRNRSGKYPLSTRTVNCATIVQAFSLDSKALEYITTHYQDAFRNPRVQGAMRYFSLYWRSLAATLIQKAWRSMKARRVPDHEQQECPIIYYEKALQNVFVYEDTKPEESSSQIGQEASPASSFKKSSGDKSNITENGNYNGNQGLSTFDVTEVKLKNNDHVEKKTWWQRSLMKLGGEQSGKKIGWGMVKVGGDNSVKKKNGSQPVKNDDLILKLGRVPKEFSYKQLRVATGAFMSKVGSGPFGSVYRGVLPSSGIQVAVKKMTGFSTHSKAVKEFATDVAVISQLKHENLIPILGSCEDIAKKEYLLVYEFMPNGNLTDALFGQGEKGTTTCLSWEQRFNIVIGIADALNYLHQGWKQQVIHGDIKPSNILLDKEWTAKLGDVGLARLANQHSAPAAVVTPTIGYMAPEGYNSQNVTDKTDVFAFGTLVLEIASGRRAFSASAPPEETVLVDWVWNSLSVGNLLNTVDKQLQDY